MRGEYDIGHGLLFAYAVVFTAAYAVAVGELGVVAALIAPPVALRVSYRH